MLLVKEFVEGPGGFLGLIEKALMHRGGRVLDVARH